MWLKPILLVLSVAVHQHGALGKKLQAFDISSSSILSKESIEKFGDILDTDGAFALTGLPLSYGKAVKELGSHAPDCLEQLRIPSFKMADGSMRTTYAAPPTDEFVNYPQCIEDAANVISSTMDAAYGKVTDMLHQLIGEEAFLWKSANDVPIEEAQGFELLHNKEHIHVYHPPGDGVEANANALVPHQDNGVLLLLTHHQEHPVQIFDKDGRRLETDDLKSDAIIVMVGRALPSWLLTGHEAAARFHPATHAVTSLDKTSQQRTVFARMMTAPLEAVSARPTRQAPRRFRDVFLNEGSNNDDLCISSFTPASGSWDEFQLTEACPEGHSYCWMSCLPVPECQEVAPVCLNNQQEPCCTSPDQEGTGTCADMDVTCAWTCP